MKRILTLALVLAMVFSLTACGPDIESMEPMDVLKLSGERMEKNDRFMMEMDMVIKVEKQKITTDCKLIYDMKNQKLSATVSSKDEEISYVYLDETLYKDTNGKKIKYSYSFDELEEVIGIDHEMVDVEDAEAFSDLELKKNDDGTFTVSGLLADEEMLSELMGTKMDEDDKISMDYIVDKRGNLVKFVLTFEMNVRGIKIEMECNAKYTFKDVEEIKAPKDADSYVKMLY